ncbi:MAG TPA: 4-hydroxybenzoate octaprenyltransferase, partial [Stellaceae bacterium]|nr:4-hydroxybenzoate octaprenyltransferase [Stellaceae bacterium]
MVELRTDIRTGDWVDRIVPSMLRPYIRLARLDRPIGTWLLL